MRSLILVLLALATCLVPARAEPLEVQVYQAEENGKPLLLVPVPTYRTLLSLPTVPEPVTRTATVPVPVDRILRTRVDCRVENQRATVRLACDLDLAARNHREIPLLECAEGVVIRSFRGPGELARDGRPGGGQGDPSGAPSQDAGKVATGALTGWKLFTDVTGPVTVEMTLLLPITRSGQGWELAIPLPVAPEQAVRLELVNEGDTQVTAKQALISRLEPSPRRTVVTAAGQGEKTVRFRWEPQVQVVARPETGARPDAGALPEPDWTPELSVQVASVANVGDTHLKARSNLVILVRRSPIRELFLVAGPAASFVDISGPLVAEWESTSQKNAQIARVSLKSPAQDKVELSVEYEQPSAPLATQAAPSPTTTAEPSFDVAFVPVQVRDPDREDHVVGIVRPSNLELAVKSSTAWRELDQVKVPPMLAGLLGGQMACKLVSCERFPKARSEGPLAPIAVVATKLVEEQMLPATIDLARAESAITEDGHLLGRVVYDVRNDSQQFLSLTPPEGAEPLTVYVAGKAVRAAKDPKTGRWLIPLGKSIQVSGGAAPFKVSVTYHQETGPLESGRRLSIALPSADLIVSALRWNVKLPKDWRITNLPGCNVRIDSEERPVKYTGETGGEPSRPPAVLFEESTLPLAVEMPQLGENFYYSQELLEKDGDAGVVQFIVARTMPAMTRRAGAFLVGVLIFYFVLRRRPEGKARAIATLLGVLGTAILMTVFGAQPNLGLWFYLASGLFMGAVIFGFSRLAVGGISQEGW